MKNSIKLILFAPVFLIGIKQSEAQKKLPACTLNTCNRTLTINRIKLLPAQVTNRQLKPTDTLTATEGQTTIEITYDGNHGEIILPAEEILPVYDLTNSSYCTFDSKDSYKAVLSSIWNFFWRNDEKTPQEYQHRYLKERIAVKRGNITDLLASNTYRTVLKTKDADHLARLNDSLRKQDVTDSTVYHLNRAIFFEQNNYLSMAKDQYIKAIYDQRKSGTKSPVVLMASQQFLYRMGRFDDAKSLTY